MSCGSCDSASQYPCSLLYFTFLLLYHLERELVLGVSASRWPDFLIVAIGQVYYLSTPLTMASSAETSISLTLAFRIAVGKRKTKATRGGANKKKAPSHQG